LAFKTAAAAMNYVTLFSRDVLLQKTVQPFKKGANGVAVFEGFFSFLSYISVAQVKAHKLPLALPSGETNYLILNSLAFLEKSRNIMEEHDSIRLYLDRDSAGMKATTGALRWVSKIQRRKPALQRAQRPE
jgi:hypothetical protein